MIKGWNNSIKHAVITAAGLGSRMKSCKSRFTKGATAYSRQTSNPICFRRNILCKNTTCNYHTKQK